MEWKATNCCGARGAGGDGSNELRALESLEAMIPKSFVLALLTLLVTGPLVAADGPPAAPARVSLAIGGEVAHPLRLSAEDLGRLPRLTVHAKDHDGKDVEYSGVSLTEVLKLAAIPTGE